MTKHQKHLAELKKRDAIFAMMFNRPPKYVDEGMADGNDGGAVGYDNRPNPVGSGSLHANLMVRGIVDVIR